MAGTYPVDDSASQVLSNTVQMKWDDPAPRRGSKATVSGAVTVRVRLDIAPWKGRYGKVYMTLPAQPSGPVTATWTTQGRLQAGTLRAGERTQVLAGVMPGGMLEDTIRLTLQTDGNRLVRVEQLQFSFEIDVGSP
jgi:YD repeat-containing protein